MNEVAAVSDGEEEACLVYTESDRQHDHTRARTCSRAKVNFSN